ncbi:acetyl-CoA C-acetyltransferase [Mangrovibacillus cuniculi]|uniref:acetyl-CoA C-acetyltransferase n=1 Tax=Mangrovibacillus cuniculi TaxID=2593652 RepID=A0A7S8HG90_9BACI|nr:acetyl-CoA C-acetyltransferase [Mangrovibacillus cuniculi]QPC47749.1 acetyl-CoA C-acetyltransferase [Mangrovibacillus cuniculi]
MGKTVIVAGARTPIGKLGGSLQTLTAPELGGKAIEAALQRAGVAPSDVTNVIMGTVLQAGQGQIPSRQAARNAGIPWNVRSETINKVCASGMRSVTLADGLLRLGEENVVVAGGMESMSNTPYALPKARWGFRMGDSQVKDLMVSDGLTCTFTGVHMGTYGNGTAEKFELSREQQDVWALRSHQNASRAIEDGVLAEEIVAVEIPQRKGPSLVVDQDESPRKDSTLEKLSSLKPVFQQDGTITAGNAPGINDGACAMVLMSEETAADKGLEPLATILSHTSIAVEAERFPETPGLVIEELLKKAALTVEDIDLFEINEAFAAVALASAKIAGVSEEKINVNGGAVALGHPIGASGARIILTLAHELKRRGGGKGIAAICSGSGQGDAVLIEVK